MYVNTKAPSTRNAVVEWFIVLPHCQKFLGSNPPSDHFLYVGLDCGVVLICDYKWATCVNATDQ